MERVVSTRLSYNDGAILGKGVAGFVFGGTLDEQLPVAVKRTQLTVHLTQQKAEAQKREEEILKSLDHPNVVKLLHIEEDITFKYYALELCDASLDQCFLKDNDSKKYKGHMPSQLQVLFQLADGLQYIHSKNLIHRDIRPENVLISNSQPSVVVKLSDCGLTKPSSVNGIKGPQFWMAPEMLRMDNKSVGHDGGSVQSDIFSLGLVFFTYVVEGNIHMFGSKNLIMPNILSGRQVNLNKLSNDHFSYDIIRAMTSREIEKRIPLSEVLGKLKV